MKIKTIKCLSILFLIMLTSCNFNANVNYENEIKVKEKAESISALLYFHTQSSEFDKVQPLFSDTFYKVSDWNQLKAYLVKKNEQLGEYQNSTLTDWETIRIEGTNPKTECFLVYKVTYSKQIAIEKISLEQEHGKMKIVAYNVDLK